MNKQIVVRNLLISYSENAGREAGAALLFLHGWRSNKEAWNGVVKRLKDLKIERLNYFAIDLPGFGGSEVPKTAWSVGDYAVAVWEFIKKLELENVILVGHSFGGRVAIKLAANNPELIKGLVLADSAGFAGSRPKKSLMATLAKAVKPVFKPQFMQGLRQGIYRKIGAEDYVATPELQQTYVKVINEDLTEDMKKVSIPTLIIWGENDKATPIEFGKRMRQLIAGSKLEVLPNAGHFSFVDQPEEFAKILAVFANI
ncbi:MAG: alpha/beta hydrolase [Patescibacteria group bacterium]|nr:alpha/beta hydrolase [Patescibacteria group bacterium]